MTRPLAVLRPEPGNATTAARIEARGLDAIRLPLFHVHPIDWSIDDEHGFDALFLTSANAPRSAGPGLGALAHLPVFAVGKATRAAAEAAGLTIAHTGERDGAALLDTAMAHGVRRGLLLSGRDHVLQPGGPIARVIAVYASDAVPVGTDAIGEITGSVALIHSVRAARRLGELVDGAGVSRKTIRLAAISAAAATAAGNGWDRISAAPCPGDDALIVAAAALAD